VVEIVLVLTQLLIYRGKKLSRMIDPEVTKAIEEDIVDESTGMEEAMSKTSIG
jgi:hypothetical protein